MNYGTFLNIGRHWTKIFLIVEELMMVEAVTSMIARPLLLSLKKDIDLSPRASKEIGLVYMYVSVMSILSRIRTDIDAYLSLGIPGNVVS